LIDKLIQN